jgi:D-sedoheptulose 7-phosphate isomerase
MCRRYPELESVAVDTERAIDAITGAFGRHLPLLIAGNGGSAADASHIAGELIKGFRSRRSLPVEREGVLSETHPDHGARLHAGLQRGLPAIALPDQTALMTAWINDGDPELVYAQMVEAFGQAGGVFWGISTSGNARNVVLAAINARSLGMPTIALTGASGGELARVSEIAIRVPADTTPEIQEFHLPVYHAICSQVEENLFQ